MVPQPAREVPDPLAGSNLPGLAFQPLHKRAFGIAVGLAAGMTVAAATVVVLLRGDETINLQLLDAYFTGYTVSWPGVLVGFGWAFVVGFTAGWFVAFCRNLALAISAFVLRARAELFQTRDFLDHI
jgi:F420-0:gamma-glutamyl ligase-like protein